MVHRPVYGSRYCSLSFSPLATNNFFSGAKPETPLCGVTELISVCPVAVFRSTLIAVRILSVVLCHHGQPIDPVPCVSYRLVSMFGRFVDGNRATGAMHAGTWGSGGGQVATANSGKDVRADGQLLHFRNPLHEGGDRVVLEFGRHYFSSISHTNTEISASCSFQELHCSCLVCLYSCISTCAHCCEAMQQEITPKRQEKSGKIINTGARRICDSFPMLAR